jgi:catechol 2,3-dioxygenase-like lactoylglutathione lyase family enzyme
MISRLHHVQITIPSDGEAIARGFYIDLLGLLEIPKPDSLKARGGFWLSLAGQEIHVSLEDGINRLSTKAHIAYEVSDLEFWRLRFKNAGFEVLEGIAIPGFERFETRDLFGNRLELIAKR